MISIGTTFFWVELKSINIVLTESNIEWTKWVHDLSD